VIILAGTNNLELNKEGKRENVHKVAHNIINKLMRIAKRNPRVKVAFLEILPRMQEGQTADMLCAAPEANIKIRKRLADPRYGRYATLIPCERTMMEPEYFNMKYPSGDKDGIHMNSRGARKMERLINKAIQEL
jgi:lysophospholipase L1-like esterase